MKTVADDFDTDIHDDVYDVYVSVDDDIVRFRIT